jgi:hypothetical protein
MKRNFYVGAIFLALFGTLVVASVCCKKEGCRGMAGVMAPDLKSIRFGRSRCPIIGFSARR